MDAASQWFLKEEQQGILLFEQIPN